ncbi:MAG: acyl-CoA thioesterase [Lachnospiraceae bacterium]
MAGREIDLYRSQKPVTIKTYEHTAKYYETDQMGIIHHSNYIRWMEEARMDLMDQMGFTYKEMEELEVISPVLSVTCEYKSMVHFDDTVVIETKMTSYNGIKMTLEYRMTDKRTGELRTLAKSEHCFLNRSGKPISLKRIYPEIDTKFFTFSEENRS